MDSSEQTTDRKIFQREQLVKMFLEVGEPPADLTKAFERHPLCHLLSKYTIRPVACDQHPFVIHHKNKQPLLLQQKKPRARQNDKGREVDNFDSDNESKAVPPNDESDDDEFETVRAEKKRGQKKTVVEPPEADPRFPASDPTKVKVISGPIREKPKKEKPAQKENDKATPNATQDQQNIKVEQKQNKPESKPDAKKEPKAEAKPPVKEQVVKKEETKQPIKEVPKKKEIPKAVVQEIADAFLPAEVVTKRKKPEVKKPEEPPPPIKKEEPKEPVKAPEPKVEPKLTEVKETKKEKPEKKQAEPAPIAKEPKRPKTARQEEPAKPAIQKKKTQEPEKAAHQGANEIFMAMQQAREGKAPTNVDDQFEEKGPTNRPQTAQPARGRGQKGRGRGRGQRGGGNYEPRGDDIEEPKKKTAEVAPSKQKAPAVDDVVEAPKEKKPVEKKPVPAKLEESKKSEDKPVKKQSTPNLEAVLQEQDKETEKKKKEQKQKAQADPFDPNDFFAAMSRGAQMQDEKDQERKAKKTTQKKPGRGGAAEAEGGQRGRGRGGKKQTEYPNEYKQNKGFASIYD